MKQVVIASFRRALIYPLYRNYALNEKLLQDVYILFRLGKRAILKALLDVKDTFDHHDVYYIYSKILIDDYCTWIQHARQVYTVNASPTETKRLIRRNSDHVLRTLAHELHHFSISKAELELDLDELEMVRAVTFSDNILASIVKHVCVCITGGKRDAKNARGRRGKIAVIEKL